jgi:hypothetical protein
VKEGRFDPIQYFGGYQSREVGTGIIRKIMDHVFAPEPKMRNIRASPDVCKNSSEYSKKVIPKLHRAKASQSQADLEPSKCTSLAEISNSLQSSQARINKLMNNLKNLK